MQELVIVQQYVNKNEKKIKELVIVPHQVHKKKTFSIKDF